ncbi:MAG TPA: RidA family protein [Bryobacteraceae bacterium]|nr:RidA family protein [Bryobacteraceae bacterium]
MKNWFAISGWVCAVALAYVVGSNNRPPRALAANGAGVRYVNSPGLAAPIARYSHAVAVPAGEELIFVSGHGGDTSKGDPVSADIVAQTRQTMENLKTTLAACGSDFAHVVKMNIYLTDTGHMPELRKVRDAYLDPKRAPAMTTAKVSQLIGADTKVEIEVVAVRSR